MDSLDPLMDRLGCIIEQMKDSFIVATLKDESFVR
jgi:hypothetical protein